MTPCRLVQPVWLSEFLLLRLEFTMRANFWRTRFVIVIFSSVTDRKPSVLWLRLVPIWDYPQLFPFLILPTSTRPYLIKLPIFMPQYILDFDPTHPLLDCVHTLWMVPKSQLISEWLFDFLNFPKNNKKIWWISTLESKKWLIQKDI